MKAVLTAPDPGGSYETYKRIKPWSIY